MNTWMVVLMVAAGLLVPLGCLMMNSSSYSPGTTGGNREDLRGPLTLLEPEATPFVSSVTKGPAPQAVYVERLADRMRAARVTGSREGSSGAKGGAKATKRQRFGVYPHRWHDTFGVTDVQEALSRAGGNATNSDEYAWSKAKTVREVKRDLEAVCCSGQETSGGADDVMLTRGIVKWLSATQTPQVPADFVPLSAARVTSVAASGFTEAAVNGVLKSMKSAYGAPRSYDCLIGNDYQEKVDFFTRVGSSTETFSRYVVEQGEEYEISVMVQVFKSSFGTANFIPTEFNRVDAVATGDPTCALFLNMELWELLFLEELHAADDEEDAGGKTGWVKAIGALSCLSPRGNGFIYNT